MMVQLCIALLVIGFLFLLAEMWMPGMEVFAITGLISLAVSAVLAVLFVPGGWFIVAGIVVVIALFLRFMYMFMKRKQLQGKLILSETLQELHVDDVSQLVGREGMAVTALRPSGEADFNGVRLEVCSNGLLVKENTKIKVVETEARKIIVCPVE
jgi:membrane-bound ClpP family serine protease